jgi:predicted nucleotidyltransferase
MGVTKRELISKHRDAIFALAAKHGMTDLRLFGSVARGDERPDSDIDFLVKRQPGSDPFEILGLKEDLEALLNCRVDILTEHPWMRPRLRDRILRDALAV